MAGPGDKTQIEYVLGLNPQAAKQALDQLSAQIKKIEGEINKLLPGKTRAPVKLQKIATGDAETAIATAVNTAVRKKMKAADNAIISAILNKRDVEFMGDLQKVKTQRGLGRYQRSVDTLSGRADLAQVSGSSDAAFLRSRAETLQAMVNLRGQQLAREKQMNAKFDADYKAAQLENIAWEKAAKAKASADLQRTQMDAAKINIRNNNAYHAMRREADAMNAEFDKKAAKQRQLEFEKSQMDASKINIALANKFHKAYEDAQIENERRTRAREKKDQELRQRGLSQNAQLRYKEEQRQARMRANLEGLESGERVARQVGDAKLIADARIKTAREELKLAQQRAIAGFGTVEETRRAEATLARELRLRMDIVAAKKQQANTPSMSPEEKAQQGFGLRMNLARQNMTQIRDLGVERAIGDGGAAMFRIQLGLMKNYMLISQMFNLISFGTRFVVELDEAFAQLQAISASSTGTMEGLKETIKEVGQTTKFSAVQVAQAAVVMAQAGFSAEQISKSIGSIALFATAVGSELEPAVDLVTSTMSIFNMRADETGLVVDVLTGALNKSKLTIEKLTLGLQYAGNTAADAGIGFTELTTVLAALSNQGIRSGSTMGTGLRQIIVDLISPSDKLVQQLSNVGLTLEDVDVRSRGLIAVLTSMKEAGFGVENAFEGMEVRAASAYAAITANTASLSQLQQQLLLTNAAAEANAVQSQSMSNVFARLAGVTGIFADNISKPLQTLIVTLAKGLNSILTWANSLGPTIKVLGTIMLALPIGVVAAGFIKLVAGLASYMARSVQAQVETAKLQLALNRLDIASGRAGAATTRLGYAFRFLGTANIIGALVAIGVTVASLTGAFSSTADAIDNARTKLEESQGAYDAVSQQIETVNDKIKELNNRYADLSEDSDALQAQTMEVRLRFGELGLEIPPLVTSVGQLTGALSSLRDRLSEIAQTNLKRVIQDLELLTSLQARQAFNEAEDLQPGNSSVTYTNMATSPREQAFVKRLGDTYSTYRSSMLNAQMTQSTDPAAALVSATSALDAATKAMSELAKEADLIEDPNSDRAKAIDEERQKWSKAASNATIVMSALQDRIVKAAESKQLQFNSEDPEVKRYGQRNADLLRFNSENLLDANMDDSERAEYIRARKAAVEQELTDLKRSVEVVRESAKAAAERGDLEAAKLLEERANNLEASDRYQEYAANLAAQKTSLDKLLGSTEASIKETNEIEAGVRDSVIERLKKDRDNLQAGSSKWWELTRQIQEAVRQKYNDEIARVGAEIEKTEAAGPAKSGVADALRKRAAELVLRRDAEVADIADIRGKASGAIEEIARELITSLEEWKNTIADAKARLQDETSQAQWGLKQFDLNLDAAKETGKYSSVDLQYAEEVTGKAKKIAATEAQLEAEKRYAETVRMANAAIKDQLELDYAAARARLDNAVTLKEQNQASKDFKAAGEGLRDVTKELNDAERQVYETEAKLAGLRGTATIQTLDMANAMGFAIDQYLKANKGYLEWDAYLKDQLPGVVSNAGGAFKTFFKTLADGSASAGDAFKALASSIIESLLDIAAQYAAMQIFKTLLGSLGIGGSSGNMFSSDGWMPMKMGGIIGRPSAMGSIVRGHYPRDSVLTPTMPGEGILTESATRMLGEGTIDRLNALGNRTVNDGSRGARYPGEKKEPVITNIWVIPPDAPRPTSKQDIVVALQDTIARDGSTKKLIRSVVRGEA